MNKTQVAQFFGVAAATISRWEARGMPRLASADPRRPGTQNTYDLAACCRWHLARLDSREASALTRERIKLTRARRERLEHELNAERSALVPVEVARSLWRQERREIRLALARVPAALLARFGNERGPIDVDAAAATVARALRDALTELAESELPGL